MNGQAQTGVNEIIQTVLDEELSLNLRARDVPLLALVTRRFRATDIDGWIADQSKKAEGTD